MTLAILFLAACYLGIAIYDRSRKKIEHVVHVQGRTEQDEQIDIMTTLFSGETENWLGKLERAWKIREHRVQFQNERAERQYKEHQEALKASKDKPALVEKKES